MLIPLTTHFESMFDWFNHWDIFNYVVEMLFQEKISFFSFFVEIITQTAKKFHWKIHALKIGMKQSFK